MTDRKLLILGIGNVALKYLEQALAPYGLQPVVFGDRQGRPADVWDNLPLSRFHHVALEYGAVERYLQQHTGLAESICAVTTLFDELFPLVEAVATAHGWDYPGAALARLSDKAVVAQLAGELSPQSHAFTACDPEALMDVLAAPGRDWVVKPACGSGGEAVGHITGGIGAVGKIRVHLARHFHLNADRWILQQRLEGVLVSFEGYLQGGRLTPVGLSRRSRIGLTEVANRFPADASLAPEQLAQGWAALAQLFERSGCRDGWFHCECIAGPAGLHLVDANAGRIGGATVLEQVALACDVMPAELLAHVLLLPLAHFYPALPRWSTPFKGTLGVWYGLPEAAILSGVEVACPSARHTRFAADGAAVPAIGTSDYAWVGMLSGQEAEVLASLATLRLHTDRGLALPAYSLD